MAALCGVARVTFELIHADCRAVMANMGDSTVDSVVCDPPYHLTSIVKRFGSANAAPAGFGTDGAFARASRGFMGKEWDGGDIAFNPELWREVWRVLKPGGHLLAFSGTRTYHRMACAIEDAGFEIRDMLSWLYGSGFPKSHNIGKALGADDPCEYCGPGAYTGLPGNACENCQNTGLKYPEAQQWAGWGTALKPACEPICFARKPLIGTVAANVLAHGTGAINIDGCRVPTDETITATRNIALGSSGAGVFGAATVPGVYQQQPGGRFPANVLHDGSPEVVDGFPREAGARAPVTVRNGDKFCNSYGAFAGRIDEQGSTFRGDSGSAARFFYCAKASKRDRDEGLDERGNTHPTVKPTDLMRWLCRLVTPPGGLVFDPFAGSGSTGKAAILEGFRFIGAEMTDEYIPIARARIEWALRNKIDRAVKAS